jgi:NAD(P)-dependent dehydrogenase (short-subunit alcohol dehydrogenase family)
MMRLALPRMKERPGAAVINIASISGWSPQLAMSGQYGATKAALIFDTERWALEFVPHGIRVNTVSPGSILVEGNGWDRYRLANPGYFEDYVRHGFPMGRLGTAEEVADVIVQRKAANRDFASCSLPNLTHATGCFAPILLRPRRFGRVSDAPISASAAWRARRLSGVRVCRLLGDRAVLGQ